MQILWLLILLLTAAPALGADDLWGDTRPVIEQKWGYIDKSGAFALKTRFLMATPFSDGVARVNNGTRNSFIDKTGKELFGIDTKGVVSIAPGAFCEGFSLVTQPDYKLGFVDKSGKLAIPLTFTMAMNFAEGLAAVSPDGKTWGFIDNSGKFVIEPKFFRCGDFSDGLARVCEGNLWGFIDRSGALKIKCRYEAVESFADGLAPVYSQKDGWFYINKSGEVAIKGPYAFALPFKHGVAMVSPKHTDKEGHPVRRYIDTAGKDLGLDPLETEAYGNGMLPLLREGKVGFANAKGETVISPAYEWTSGFSEGLAGVKLNGKWGFIDESGKMIIPAKFSMVYPFSDGLSVVTSLDDSK